MNITDPIADMLTRIRNANSSKHKTVDIPSSNMKLGIAEILFREGYIKSFEEIKNENQGIIRITLKYDEKGKRVIDGLKRMSAIAFFIFEAGTSTVLCFLLFAFLILVNISAIGSVVFKFIPSFFCFLT